jgi:hypothetical protein
MNLGKNMKNMSKIPKFVRKFEFQMPRNYLRGLMASISQIIELDSTYTGQNSCSNGDRRNWESLMNRWPILHLILRSKAQIHHDFIKNL